MKYDDQKLKYSKLRNQSEKFKIAAVQGHASGKKSNNNDRWEALQRRITQLK